MERIDPKTLKPPLLVLLQAVFFILLFIFLPLFIFKKNDIKKLSSKSLVSFIVFFGCLGSGFMFIEIPMMQRFVLLLGSPIHSITVVLSVLLISTGTGSLMLPWFSRIFKSDRNLLFSATVFIFLYLVTLITIGTNIYDHFVGYSFPMRVILVGLILFPLGISLGFFFPSGLQLMSRVSQDSISWAWAINGGFSVLGSILSIILAQFMGFNTILMAAVVVYLIGLLAFFRLEESIN